MPWPSLVISAAWGLLGIFVFGWNTTNVISFFWFGSAVVGFYTFVKIATAQPLVVPGKRTVSPFLYAIGFGFLYTVLLLMLGLILLSGIAPADSPEHVHASFLNESIVFLF